MTTAPRAEARFLLDGLGTRGFRDAWCIWWAHLFPTAEFMRARYPVCDARLVPLLYVWRLCDGGYKFIRSAI